MEGDVLVDRHPGGALRVLHGRRFRRLAGIGAGGGHDGLRDEVGRVSGLVAAAKEEERRVHHGHRSTGTPASAST
ncbi:hypothetical protein Cus16_0634 [Curtobacterium sp. ER1/6]|nr:hypothetical protein Cus16_0634 [Curtobacterium sp. ER1/6]